MTAAQQAHGERGWTPADDEVAGLLRGRRTVHDFEPGRTPPVETLMQGLDLARWAPNHHGTEPWHFYLLGPVTAGAIAELNAQLVAAGRGEQACREKLARWRAIPGWLLVTCDRSRDVEREREDYAACCCAVATMENFGFS